MVLNRGKRSNAGKGPRRLDEPPLSTPPPSTPSTSSKKATKPARPAKRLVLSIKPKGTQAMQVIEAKQASSIRPASLRHEEDTYYPLKRSYPQNRISQPYGSGPSVDIWALGVIAFEWLYGIPDCPTVPTPRTIEKGSSAEQWYEWIDTWSEWLLHKLDDEEDDHGPVVKILLGMLEVLPRTDMAHQSVSEGGFPERLI